MRTSLRLRPAARDVAAATAGTVVASLPVFLLGALAVQMRSSLGFGAEGLGLVVALYYMGAGVSSVTLGHVVERVGGLRTMRVASLVSSAALVLVAIAVDSLATLAPVVVLAGLASAAMQPATNLFLARRVRQERQGLAFGLKQAAVPAASLLAGLSVPALALTVGWRWAFAVAAGLAATIAISLPRPHQSLSDRRAQRTGRDVVRLDWRPLVVLSAGFGLGVAAAAASAAFLVSSAVAAGLGRGEAGLLAAFAGAVAAASRVATGSRADRRGRAHFVVVSAMLAVGALGYSGLAIESARHLGFLWLPGVALAFGAGWGWNGLFTFAVVRTHAEQPAAATGVTQAGGRVGGMLGPLVFGQLVAWGSYSLAWALAAAAALASAAAILFGRHLLIASREARRP